MQVLGLNKSLLDIFVDLELVSGKLSINPDVLVDVLEGVLLHCPSNLNSSKDCHSVGDGVAPR